MDVAIVGGGIGGLTLALALQKVGITSRVFEQTPELTGVGAGIGLWPGALKALRELDVSPWFWDLPVCPFRWAETADARGRRITGFDVSGLTDGLGYVVRRSDLQSAVLEQLPAGTLVTGARLTGLVQHPDHVELRFEDSVQHAPLVVGADGLRSAVRTLLLGAQEPRYSGETCYRGIAPFAVEDPGMMRETQSEGWRGCLHPLDAETVYWWVTRRAQLGEQETPEQRKTAVLAAVRGWVGGMPDAVAATPAEVILKNDLFDRPAVPQWSFGRVTLVGDAAHPTTPNLGLGGCMAIEDALVLARALAHNPDHERAFAQYESQRHARTARVTRMSRAMGRSGSFTHPFARAAWAAVNTLTPSAVPRWLLAREVTYDPGQLSDAS